MPDEKTAVASPAAEETVTEVPRNSEDYAEWRLSGKFPDKVTQPKPQESAPAGAEETLEDTEAPPQGDAEIAPHSEAETIQEQRRKGRGAQARISELTAQRKAAEARAAQLERELAEAKQPRADRRSEQAPQPARSYAEWRKTFNPDQWISDWLEKNPTGSYERAMMELNDHLDDAREGFRRSEAAQNEAVQRIAHKLEQARGKYADFDQKVPNVIQGIMGDPAIPAAVKGAIDGSELLPHLLYVMGADDAEFAQFVALAKSNPRSALRQVFELERLIEEELSGPHADAKEQPQRQTDGKFAAAKPPETRVSQAPPPPQELSGRGHAPTDEAEAALKKNDFTAFKNARNRADMARRRGM